MQITWECGNTGSEYKQIQLMNLKIIFLTKITFGISTEITFGIPTNMKTKEWLFKNV